MFMHYSIFKAFQYNDQTAIAINVRDGKSW